MKKIIAIIIYLLFTTTNLIADEYNFLALYAWVDIQRKEHDIQKETYEQSNIVLSQELAIKKQNEQIHKKMITLNYIYSGLGIAMDAGKMIYQGNDLIQKIIETNKAIINLYKNNPSLIVTSGIDVVKMEAYIIKMVNDFKKYNQAFFLTVIAVDNTSIKYLCDRYIKELKNIYFYTKDIYDVVEINLRFITDRSRERKNMFSKFKVMAEQDMYIIKGIMQKANDLKN